ncbi:MAG: hypothetical protein GKR88_06020 [Flavobacteriaceae bacterium]|nr:MAG: hypothetical protein GKR88_06020 [Flavobacteriaceae bacterium]
MKKCILLLLAAITFSFCKKDDFCVEPVTPNLILRLYNSTNPTELKSGERLSIWADGRDTLPQYTSVTLDSVVIPLNLISNQTVYNFKINTVDGNIANNRVDQLTVNYTTEEVYISRSCGFRVIFNNVTVTSNNGWILSLSPSSIATINNESSAHVQIFH